LYKDDNKSYDDDKPYENNDCLLVEVGGIIDTLTSGVRNVYGGTWIFASGGLQTENMVIIPTQPSKVLLPTIFIKHILSASDC